MTLSPALSAVPLFLVAASVFILGIVVMARDRASPVSLSFLALTGSVSIWLFSIAFMLMADDTRTAMFFAKLAYVGVAIIPAAVLHFTVALLDETRQRRMSLLVCWITSFFFVGLFTMTRLLLVGTWHYDWGYYPHLTALTGIFLLYFGALLTWSLALLVRKEPITDQEHQRNLSFLFALGIGYFGCVDYLPAFGIPLYPLGFLGILGFIVLATRATLRFDLTDLSPTFVADQLMQTVHGGVIVVDNQGRIRVSNHAAADLLSYTMDELRGADLCKLLGVTTLPSTDTESFCRRSISRNKPTAWRGKNGRDVELSVSATGLRDNAGARIGVLYAISDLADRRRAERNEFSATHDMLTSLPNRTRLAQLFDELRTTIDKNHRVGAVFFIDLDGFKAVNDRFGHATGDALLQVVAQRLRNAVRGDDVIARHGGDEFVVALNIARIADGTVVAEKLLRVISEAYAIADNRITITASIGAAFYPRDGVDLDILIATADAAMYAAKSDGKARLRVSAPRSDKPARPPFGIDAQG